MKQKLLVIGLGILWAAVINFAWSPAPYWPDSVGYTSHIAEGRWVAHPPGYPFFVFLGHGFHALGLTAYQSTQSASLLLTILGITAAFLLAKPFCGVPRAFVLAGGLAFSWIVLLIGQTGTSHAADILTVSVLLYSAIHLRSTPSSARVRCLLPLRDMGFGIAIILCAGFRFTTLIMMVPLFLFVAWNNRGRLSFWLACGAAALGVALLQLWVIRQSDGYETYSELARAMNERNSFSSVVLNGFSATTLFNIIRAIFWFGLGSAPFLVVSLLNLRPVRSDEITPLLYGVAATIGSLGVAVLYLCTHPGYVAAALPGMLVVAAVAWGNQPCRKVTFIGGWFALGLILFLSLQPYQPPHGKRQAILNGLLFQYGGASSRRAVFHTTAGWLREAGLENEIPPNRLHDLRQDDEGRQKRPFSGPTL